jgi:hypothetical protein
MGVVSAQKRPDRGSENLLQMMEILKIRVIHNLNGVVVNEEVMESIKVRKGGQRQQKGQQQEVAPES